METYSRTYFDLIRNGLEHMLVTDSAGQKLLPEQGFSVWAEKAYTVQQKQGQLFFCGNGASASMAEHMSHDWFQNAEVNTTTCAEVTHITAISNDLSYEDVFSYRIQRILSHHDILIGISSSGNSKNIVRALNAAKEKGAFVITLSGKRLDNQIRKMGNLNFYVPLEHYGEVESAHAVLLHSALDYFLDKYMKGRH